MSTHDSPLDHFEQWLIKVLSHRQHLDIPQVYQTSTISALLDGVYDGDVTIAEILRHGDFGLGTFNGLDGEMVILDGICYHLHADGTATKASPADRTPFCAVTRFHANTKHAVEQPSSRAQVLGIVDDALDSANLIHAVKITGTFTNLHTRTVTEQIKPYPPLTAATEGQAETTFDRVSGVMVGFRTPELGQGISVAGYHLHFLDDPRTRGGHVLDFRLDCGEVAVSTESELHLSLPTNPEFLRAKLTATDMGEQIRRAEGGN
ncbi:acetolactate decarboxylase [Mycobacterium sp. 236(2023)]|uniref:acetolactate decarboxylase n=1 Tax=Mycobacterium sp. 236(2023) TaxID=3038163 RepID=UPI002414D827|nr:acetolactate decarboxylase [Mycobacterium sp. 236(2023)]MDG4667523.1 acetolactate decarboxylase [Mycobacterium sp. 236(2023)]